MLHARDLFQIGESGALALAIAPLVFHHAFILRLQIIIFNLDDVRDVFHQFVVATLCFSSRGCFN